VNAARQCSIRPAEEPDISSIVEVERSAGRRFRDLGLDAIADSDPPSDPVLLGRIEAGAAWVAVAEPARVLGYATASIVDSQAHLEQVSVLEDAGRRGIGRGLIETVHDWARQQGLAAITLTTFATVPWNGPYYRSLGYQELSEDAQGPALRALRRAEREAGLDVVPRVAMRRALAPR
jgi:GNAT superfamily N-acetyltransferase